MSLVVRTLVGNGFVLDSVSRHPTYLQVICHRFDEFGAASPYILAVTDGGLSIGDARSLVRVAKKRPAQLVVVGEDAPDGLVRLDWQTFLARLGGPVKSWVPLDPSFAIQLDRLGHNQPVDDLPGRPNILFEEYVHAGLLFLLASRVIRYGQDRAGEAVPDGTGFLGPQAPPFLYDAKAYKDGYKVDRSSIRQFADYVHAFLRCYEIHLGRPHSFLVISGHFVNDSASRQARAQEMYAECQIPLVFVTARDLGVACALLAARPSHRTVLDWRQLCSRLDLTAKAVEDALRAIDRDGLVR